MYMYILYPPYIFCPPHFEEKEKKGGGVGNCHRIYRAIALSDQLMKEEMISFFFFLFSDKF